MTLKTWKDIEERSRVDPFLHRLVTWVEIGEVTREQALIAVVLAQSETIEQLQKRVLDELNRKPFSLVILPRE